MMCCVKRKGCVSLTVFGVFMSVKKTFTVMGTSGSYC